MGSNRWLGVVLALVPTVGCAGGGDLGATPGGEQDDALFQETVDRGAVPQPSTLTVPGFLAVHDLPLETPPCTQVLCVSTGIGVARSLDTNTNQVFVQVGFDSGIDASTFKRAPLNLVAVVDRSGSMYGEKIAAARTALHHLIDKLTSADRFGIIIFDDRVDILAEAGPVTDKGRLHSLVDTIQDRGSTDIESALDRGFRMVAAGHGGGRSDRVILMTDAQPNTGRTGTTAFQDLVSKNAAQGIGLTAMGIGLDFGQDLVLAITHARGGNYFFLADAARIATVFDQDFDYLVTPLAYDLHMTLTAAQGYRIRQVYGLPASPEGRTVALDVATVFLSKNHGALLVQLEPTATWGDGHVLAETSLTYQGAESPTAAPIDQTGSAGYTGTDPLTDNTVWFSQRGVSRTVALVNAAVSMRAALTSYQQGARSTAQSQVRLAETALQAEIQAESQLGAQTQDLGADLATAVRLEALMGGQSLAPLPTATPPNPNPQPTSYPNQGNDMQPLPCQAAPGRATGAVPAVIFLLLAGVLGRVLLHRRRLA